MGWKDWPTWLKGGVIGLIVSIPITLIVFSLSLNCAASSIYGSPSCPFTSFFVKITLLKVLSFDSIGIFIFLFPILEITLIGAIIGWIVGKIKGR